MLNSDKVRLNLLNEEAALTKKLEDGDTSVTERLQQVTFNILVISFSSSRYPMNFVISRPMLLSPKREEF